MLQCVEAGKKAQNVAHKASSSSCSITSHYCVCTLLKSSYSIRCVHTLTVSPASLSMPTHWLRFSPQTAAASPPSILLQTQRGAMISLFPTGRTRPNPHLLQPRPVSLMRGRNSVLTNTDSLRHSRASGAPLLFWPTRKSPRQATPPPRHREQQHEDWRRTRSRWRHYPEINEVTAEKDGKYRPETSRYD